MFGRTYRAVASTWNAVGVRLATSDLVGDDGKPGWEAFPLHRAIALLDGS
jgi:hypothetical protein